MNCATSGDLCIREGVTSYPSLFLYKRGVLFDKYENSRDLELIGKYIDNYLVDWKVESGTIDTYLISPVGPVTAVAAAHPVKEDVGDASLSNSDKDNSQDNMDISTSMLKSPKVETKSVGSKVLSLDSNTFFDLRGKTSKPSFVKFFAPW